MGKAYQTIIKTEKNILVSDEPESHGGEDIGFSPLELMASALGSCTAITLRMYAERKKWPLEDVRVEVIFERDEEKNTSSFDCVIELTGDLTENQKQKMLEIAAKCPIHKTLKNPIEVSTELK